MTDEADEIDPSEAPLDEIKAPAGLTVYVNGFPFQLKDETTLLGREANWQFAQAVK